MIEITLRYKDKDYIVIDNLSDWSTDENDEPVEGDCFIWTEGNYSCDCNRSLFIKRGPAPDFPDMGCGNTIELIAMKKPKLSAEGETGEK